MKLQSYAEGKWHTFSGAGTDLFHAVNGHKVAEISSDGLDFGSMLHYGRNLGGQALRKMTFHERALMLKALAKYLLERKEEFYKVSEATGATRADSWIDIEGGIGTLFVYSGKGRRELPNEKVYLEGSLEQISKQGTFAGHHICVPLEGTAIHINAFNFPCWGMLEKLAPTFLAGMPAIVKPASSTAYLAESMVKAIIESNILPPGALQLICGSSGDILDHLTCQDVVTFTGSAFTGQKLKQHPKIIKESVRFNMEADSLNFSMLAPDATPDTPEFELFIKEVAREMTVKAGQKCTAIRRTLVPRKLAEQVIAALAQRLEGAKPGDPAQKGVRMGPLAGKSQQKEVRQRVEELKQGAELVYGDPDNFELVSGDKEAGSYFPSLLFYSQDSLKSKAAHEIEAFGPVNTIMPYDDIEQAIELAKMGKGSLVGSLFTNDNQTARSVILGTAAYHGRIVTLNRDSAGESTGHGSPLPHLVHGGPGRAGGGEEMGGIRGVLHYMQRTAIQGSPSTLGAVANEWLKGGQIQQDKIHPFRKFFDELQIGETLVTHRRTITEADVVNFAGISGDFFYAHMDDIAARESLFEKRVAHGYFVLSAAAGLFVDPAPGPVLANYGLENLRFIKPVYPGDSIFVQLTCKRKTAKEDRPDTPPQGVVEWAVDVRNQDDESVALYSILTLVKKRE
jgi:oxepin-CoA hydrolase/3-oxo-5,6-dehydrosuberyl-CoA semialdehyde dehydrogenase